MSKIFNSADYKTPPGCSSNHSTTLATRSKFPHPSQMSRTKSKKTTTRAATSKKGSIARKRSSVPSKLTCGIYDFSGVLDSGVVCDLIAHILGMFDRQVTFPCLGGTKVPEHCFRTGNILFSTKPLYIEGDNNPPSAGKSTFVSPGTFTLPQAVKQIGHGIMVIEVSLHKIQRGPYSLGYACLEFTRRFVPSDSRSNRTVPHQYYAFYCTRGYDSCRGAQIPEFEQPSITTSSGTSIALPHSVDCRIPEWLTCCGNPYNIDSDRKVWLDYIPKHHSQSKESSGTPLAKIPQLPTSEELSVPCPFTPQQALIEETSSEEFDDHFLGVWSETFISHPTTSLDEIKKIADELYTYESAPYLPASFDLTQVLTEADLDKLGETDPMDFDDCVLPPPTEAELELAFSFLKNPDFAPSTPLPQAAPQQITSEAADQIVSNLMNQAITTCLVETFERSMDRMIQDAVVENMVINYTPMTFQEYDCQVVLQLDPDLPSPPTDYSLLEEDRFLFGDLSSRPLLPATNSCNICELKSSRVRPFKSHAFQPYSMGGSVSSSGRSLAGSTRHFGPESHCAFHQSVSDADTTFDFLETLPLRPTSKGFNPATATFAAPSMKSIYYARRHNVVQV